MPYRAESKCLSLSLSRRPDKSAINPLSEASTGAAAAIAGLMSHLYTRRRRGFKRMRGDRLEKKREREKERGWVVLK